MKISASSSRFCFQLVAVAFSLVVFSCAAGAADTPQRSRIYVYDLRTHSSKLVFTADTIWEAPNWSPDGKYLISNSGGAIYKFVLKPDGTSETPQKLAIPDDHRCNNDKAISPDGTKLAFSASVAPQRGSQVFLANVDGTAIKLMAGDSP